jgi:manganese/zinc/iron transport system substrate-binding protein
MTTTDARDFAPPRRALLCFAGASLLALLGCSRAARADGRLLVVSTIGPLHDLVARLCGADLDARCLLGTGTDPHTYQPTRRDIAELARADLVVANGLHLEAPMGATFEALERGRRRLHVAAESVPTDFLLLDDSGHGLADPHLWMDPSAWTLVARGLAEALGALAPEHRTAIRTRLEALERDIALVDAYAREVLGTVPERARVLVTAHDAFGYWARRYGYEVAPVQGLSTQTEAGVRRIQELVDLVVERELPAVFVEESVGTRALEALVAGAARAGRPVAIGGSLFSDSLGPPGTYRGTYVGMLDHNATVVALALGGRAPAGGLSGRLLDQS